MCTNDLGVKGVGEVANLGAPGAIGNALSTCLAETMNSWSLIPRPHRTLSGNCFKINSPEYAATSYSLSRRATRPR